MTLGDAEVPAFDKRFESVRFWDRAGHDSTETLQRFHQTIDLIDAITNQAFDAMQVKARNEITRMV